MNVLAERLREERKQSNLTQNDMAKLLNVKRATYGEYERGNNLPPVDKLKAISNCFGVSMDYLVGNTEHHLNINEIVKQIETLKMIACTLEGLLK